MQISHAPLLVDKELITDLRFPNEDVLDEPKQRRQRLVDLKNANELGDLVQYKVKIHFMDDAGLKKVETTVWNVQASKVFLKYGISIPIRRVLRVIFP